MTSERSSRAALVAILTAGLAVAAGIVWPAEIAAQPAPNSRPSSAQPAPKGAVQPDRQKRQTEAAGLRDYVVVKSSVDRSAVWIGDRFSFIVEVECSHGTDILTDDLSRDRLQLDELDILGVEERRDDRGNGRVAYRFVYRLTTYSFEPPVKNIREMRLRYFVRRPGQRTEDIAPEGEVLVPGTQVSVRSLLPDDANFTKYRSDRPPLARSAVFAQMERIGIGLVIVSIVPAALLVFSLERRWRHRRRRQSARKLRHDERVSLDDVRALDVGGEEGRKQVFDQLSALVRKHVTGAWGVNADGLTVAEITAALREAGKSELSAEATSFLDTCEKARYGSAAELPSREACHAAIDRAERLVGLGRA